MSDSGHCCPICGGECPKKANSRRRFRKYCSDQCAQVAAGDARDARRTRMALMGVCSRCGSGCHRRADGLCGVCRQKDKARIARTRYTGPVCGGCGAKRKRAGLCESCAKKRRSHRQATCVECAESFYASNMGVVPKCCPACKEAKARRTAKGVQGNGIWRLRKHGISQEMFDAMIEAQAQLCLICGEEMSLLSRRKDTACIDHNHDTGVIRGIICNDCNRGLGMFRDNLERVQRAAQYLEVADG